MNTYYDLSHPFDENSYHPFGFPSFVNREHFTSHGCRHAIATFSLHTSTHIDAPYHMVEDGKPLEDISLAELIGPAVVVDLSPLYGPESTPSQAVNVEQLEKGLERAKLEVRAGDALILYLGRANQYLTDTYRYYTDYSTLGFDACQWIVQHNVRLVGLDAPDIDLPQEYLCPPYAPVNHRYLLERNIYVIENVGGEITKLLNRRIELIPAPLKVKGSYASGSPVRLLARV